MRKIYFITSFIPVLLMAIGLPVLVSAMSITIGIPEKFSEVKAGERVYFETEVKWPENVGRKDLRIEYYVKDKDGNEVAYIKVLKAIETQASFMDFISIPESVSPGMYKIVANLGDYKDLNQDVAASFNIVASGNGILGPSYFYVILGALGVVGVIGIIIIIKMSALIKNANKLTGLFLIILSTTISVILFTSEFVPDNAIPALPDTGILLLDNASIVERGGGIIWNIIILAGVLTILIIIYFLNKIKKNI